MKKHGCLWWLFIGWWWAPIQLILREIFATKKVGPVPQAQSSAAPRSGARRPAQDGETHKVAGTSFRQEAIRGLGVKNEDYTLTKKALQEEDLIDEWVYEYDFAPRQAELVPEPENPHDPKAIKVIVDGTHIGYIKAGSCAHVHKLLQEGRIAWVRCKIGGGRCKMLATGYNDAGRQILTMEQDDIPFHAQLKIVLKS